MNFRDIYNKKMFIKKKKSYIYNTTRNTFDY